MTASPVIYEVTLEVDPAISGEFDRWLSDHVQAMLLLPGFCGAQQLPATESSRGWPTRVVRYTLASQADLDAYFSRHAARMRADATERFGERFRASRRVFTAESSDTAAPVPSLNCLNCGTLLTGKYCRECGQPNHTYVAPLFETIEEFFGNHFGLDTRFFRSVVPLLLRPGFLSREYCAGRRERYIKPLRLYLFCSILFFFCAGWLMPSNFGESGSIVNTPASLNKDQREQLQKNLQSSLSGIADDPDLSPEQKARLEDVLKRGDATLGGKSVAAPDRTKGTTRGESFSDKLRHVSADTPEFINTLLYHTMPKVMFVFLPLVALMLKLFYIRRRHLYMEHLIFTLHCHALFFIVLLVGVVTGALARRYAWPPQVMDSIGSLIKWYLAIYLVLALRNFYQQSWGKNLVKFCLMFVGYFVLVMLGFVGAFFVTLAEV